MDEEQKQSAQITSPEEIIIRPRYPRAAAETDLFSRGYGYGYGSSDDEGQMSLKGTLRLIRKRKWLILAVTIIGTSLVALQMYRTPSTFKAATLVEVGKETPLQLKQGELMVQSDDPDSLKTTMLMVKSDPVLQATVKKLALDKNDKFLHPDQETSLPDAVGNLLSGIFHRGKKAGSDPDSAPGADDQLDAAKQTDALASRLDLDLSVDLVRDTRALSISYTSTDPALAADVANGVAQSFIDLKFRGQTEQYTNTSEWLDRSTRELKAGVEKAEQDLATYTKDHNIFSADNKETLTTAKLTHLHDQATRTATDRMLKQSVYDEVKAGRVSSLPEAYLDPRLQAIQKTVGDLQTQKAQLLVKFGPVNPKVVEITEQINELQHQLDEGLKGLEEKLKGDYERAARDEQSLNTALAAAQVDAVKENQDAIQYNILKQELDTAKSLYTEFLQKTHQANLEVAQQHSNIHVIQPAKPPKEPIGPKRGLSIVAALLATFGGSIVLVFVLERLDNTIKTTEDVSRYIQLPTLGVIPLIGAGASKKLTARTKQQAGNRTGALVPRNGGSEMIMPGLQLGFDAYSAAAEAYRALRTSVLLSCAGAPPKKLLITSSQPGEGKTTTVINTAISLAQLGAPVLILDCDLRKPSVHRCLGIGNDKGVSTYLSGGMDVEASIVRTAVPNLFVLPSGPIPPNPAELLSSDKMKLMLEYLCERYQHILIDSPPLINVTDPVILSTMADGVMVVVSWGKSSRDLVRRVRQELTLVGAKIFGVLLNGVDLRRDGYGEEYYRYYSGYGESATRAK
jgi:succinoglycan biosynthesis transport protein ExoP